MLHKLNRLPVYLKNVFLLAVLWPVAMVLRKTSKAYRHLWLVAERDGAICGYVGSQTVLGESDVMNVAVLPTSRGGGVATALMRQLMAQLRANGSGKLLLEVRESNLPARGLYAKLGFEEVGRRKNYYRDPREDALILSVSLKEVEP